MPTLRNPRQEAFAQARAGGALLDDAYEAAGFAPGNRHAAGWRAGETSPSGSTSFSPPATTRARPAPTPRSALCSGWSRPPRPPAAARPSVWRASRSSRPGS